MAELKTPRHIAIIMDGNRRWAAREGVSVDEGHRAGYQTLRQTATAIFDRGVPILSVYAFSTENWQRGQEEVGGLMKLLRFVLKSEVKSYYQKEGIRLLMSGSREGVAADILKGIDKAVAQTKDNQRGTLNVCFNYGGRADLVGAAKKLVSDGVAADAVDEATFSSRLSTAGLPDVDLLIRTSEYRLSGFLPWESTYAEIFFLPDLLWPDFSKEHLDLALQFYKTRQRRFGT